MVGDLKDGADCGYSKLATVIDFQIIVLSEKKETKEYWYNCTLSKILWERLFKPRTIYKLTIAIGKNQKLTANFDYTIQNRRALENIKRK